MSNTKKTLMADDLVIGAKYVPHQKTGGFSDALASSAVWQRAIEAGQPFLYYTGISLGTPGFNDRPYDGYVDGDVFNPEDVTVYQEEETTLYEQLTKLCSFQVGDTVKITHKVPSYNMGWQNSWIDDMDYCVGKTAKIVRVGDKMGLNIDINSFNFPVQCMQLVTRKEDEVVDFSCLYMTVTELTEAVGIDTTNQILKLIKESKKAK